MQQHTAQVGDHLTNAPTIAHRAIVPNFVAEIAKLRLDAALPDQSIEALKTLWNRYPVLVFPEQSMDPEALEGFARRLGDIGHDPFIKPAHKQQHVVEVRREPGETAPIFGASWHSDWSFQARPPSGTLLHAKIVPPFGGDTVFADCCAAYDALPTDLKDELAELKGIHSAAPSYGPNGLFAKDDASRSMQIVVSAEAERRETHPIVRTHARNGRRGLFVNHVYTLAVAGMNANASRALLRRLFKHMTRPDFVYRHRWQANTLLAWDNRSVVHYADGGYEGFQRLMYRVTLAGERPQ